MDIQTVLIHLKLAIEILEKLEQQNEFMAMDSPELQKLKEAYLSLGGEL